MRSYRRNILLGTVLISLSIVGGFGLAYRHSSAASAMGCGTTGKLYQVVIRNGYASPENTDARLCDRLRFTNKDNMVREIAFGPHEKHVPYDGVTAKVLGYNQSFTITLKTAGLYHFHDHFHDDASGFFNVSK